jgi:hypothetical protein
MFAKIKAFTEVSSGRGDFKRLSEKLARPDLSFTKTYTFAKIILLIECVVTEKSMELTDLFARFFYLDITDLFAVF